MDKIELQVRDKDGRYQANSAKNPLHIKIVGGGAGGVSGIDTESLKTEIIATLDKKIESKVLSALDIDRINFEEFSRTIKAEILSEIPRSHLTNESVEAKIDEKIRAAQIAAASGAGVAGER